MFNFVFLRLKTLSGFTHRDQLPLGGDLEFVIRSRDPGETTCATNKAQQGTKTNSKCLSLTKIGSKLSNIEFNWFSVDNVLNLEIQIKLASATKQPTSELTEFKSNQGSLWW